MKKTILALTLAAGMQIATPAGAGKIITEDASGFLNRADTIFAVVERIENDELTLHLLHTVMSRNADTILFVGDEIHATLLPLETGKTRQTACVTSITGREGKAILVHRRSDFPRPGCLASVGDFRGASSLPADRIAVDMVTTIQLNGDLIMDDPK